MVIARDFRTCLFERCNRRQIRRQGARRFRALSPDALLSFDETAVGGPLTLGDEAESENRETPRAVNAMMEAWISTPKLATEPLTRDARYDGRFFGPSRRQAFIAGRFARPPHPSEKTSASCRRPPRRRRPVFALVCVAGRRVRRNSTLGAALHHRIPRARIDRAGRLDEANVDALAERLGIGERQLRRLFRQHLGASPISVAQTRRVLLAKQLIQDTGLPMTEVAAAAGFGSVRQFNEIFQQLYRRPPMALCGEDGKSEASVWTKRARSRSGSGTGPPTTGIPSVVPRSPRNTRHRGGLGRANMRARSGSATPEPCW